MAAKATYRRATDTLSIVAEAVYGPALPATRPRPAQCADRWTRTAANATSRPTATTRLELSSLLGSYPHPHAQRRRMDRVGRRHLPGRGPSLPELEFRAQLEVDASVEPSFAGRDGRDDSTGPPATAEPASTGWIFRRLALPKRPAVAEEVERLITEGKPYVRAPTARSSRSRTARISPNCLRS